MTKKIIPHNKPVKRKRKTSKQCNFPAKMHDLFLSELHMTDKMIVIFADNMMTYFEEHPDVMHINKYHLSQGVTHNMYQSWLLRSPYLKQRHDYCKTLIGLRREEKIAKHDPKTLTHTLHLYSDEWKQANEDHAKQKDKFRSNHRDIKVSFTNFQQEPTKIEDSDEK